MIYDVKNNNIIIGYLSGSVEIYNLEEKQKITEKQISSVAIRGMSLLQNNSNIIISDDKGMLYLVDSNTLQKRIQFYAHLDAIRSVISHPQNNNLIFTAGDDAIIRVWYFENVNKQPQLLAELISEDNSPITYLSFDVIGNRLIATQNHSIKIYDTSVFQDIQDFKQKVQQGKIGSVNVQTQSLIDQLNIKNLEKLGQYALNSVTNYVMGGQQQKDIKIDKSLTSLTAMYSIKSEQQYSSAIWLAGNVLSDLTQENPYSNGQLQYIAAGTSENQIQIIDSYSKQQIKNITLGNGTELISQLLQIDDYLIATSNDNFVYFININEMKIEKQLNYQMERCWCGCTCLGFDQGYVVLQTGDVEAKIAVYQSLDRGKIRICCQSDQINWNQNLNQFKCKIGKKLYFSNKIQDVISQSENQEFKEIEKQFQVKDLQYTPNGKFITVQTDNSLYILNSLTGKEKGVLNVKNVSWKQDFEVSRFQFQKPSYQIESDDKSLIYGVLSEKNLKTIKIYDQQDNQEPICQIQADNTVQKIIQGPILTVIEQDCIQFFTYEDGLFLTQIDIQAKDIKWNQTGELCAIISDEMLYVLKFNFNTFIEGIQSEEYDEAQGIDQIFEQLFSIEKQITDIQFSQDSTVMLIQCQKKIYQIWLQEAIKFENIEMTELEIDNISEITMLQLVNIDNKNYLIYMYNDKQQSTYNIAYVIIDTSLQEFKTMVNEGKIEEAIEFSKQWNNNEIKLIAATEYLNNAGVSKDIIEKVLQNEQIIFKYACQNNDIELLLKYKNNNKQIVASKCFEYGSTQSAQQIYEELQDYPMTVLCAYINGDKDKLEELEQKENLQQSMKNQIKLILDEDIEDMDGLFENKELFTKERVQLLKEYVKQSQDDSYTEEFKQKFRQQLLNIGLKDLVDSIK